ncbi:Protein CBG06306 [Caenorhabditis briggsae]|uniref:Protein CBG06306 n=1 Tax=Caenorhabditis briggsae TaxID=6238 RepID=A8X1X3_CAEBR|nr:Protein CBG06306 [Caenorhabditis briggsae]CAP26633.2 Protein CBG06306 [Caenorhabditis briggsae]
MLAFYLEDADQMELRKFVLKRIPCPTIDFYDKNTLVLLKGGELLPFLSITAALLIMLGQTLFFSIHTVYHLNYVKNAHVSESTKALQKRFLRYVALQRIPCPTIDFYDKNTCVLLKGGELLPFLAITGGLVIMFGQTLFFSIDTVYHLNYVRNATVSESTKALQKRFLRHVALQHLTISQCSSCLFTDR